MKRHFFDLCLIVIGLLSFATGANAIDFVTNYTYFDPISAHNAIAFEGAVERAANTWGKFVADDILVDLNVLVVPMATSNLGTMIPDMRQVDYSDYRSMLMRKGTKIANELPSTFDELNFLLPANTTLNGSNVLIPSPLHKALDAAAPDPSVTVILNANLISRNAAGGYDLQRQGGINSEQFDLETIVTREIAKGFGFATSSSTSLQTTEGVITPAAMDLFMFSDDQMLVPDFDFRTATRSLEPDHGRVYFDMVDQVQMSNINPDLWLGNSGEGTETGLMEDELWAGEPEPIWPLDRRALRNIGYDIPDVVAPDTTQQQFNGGRGGGDAPPYLLPADVCQDGVTDPQDVDPFMDLLDLHSPSEEKAYVLQNSNPLCYMDLYSLVNANVAHNTGDKATIDLADEEPFLNIIYPGGGSGSLLVPEPSSLSIFMVLGLASLGLRRRNHSEVQ